MSELQNIKLREARWVFCLALYNWRDQGASESSLKDISDGMKFELSESEIREQMTYLKQLGYCTIETLPTGTKFAVRTSALSDLVEYNSECPHSIARPDKKWW